MSAFERLRQACGELLRGSPPDRRLAWKRLSAEGLLWKACREVVARPSADDVAGLVECIDALVDEATLAFLARGRSEDEGHRLRDAAVCVVTAARAVVECGANEDALRARLCDWPTFDAALSLLRDGPRSGSVLRVPVLLTNGGSGHVSWLWVERQADEGEEFFQATSAAFDPVGEGMRQALDASWRHIVARRGSAGVVRWWMTQLPAGEECSLDGASLQGAAEVGLTLLLDGRPYDPLCAITATVPGFDGRLATVAGLEPPAWPKLHAALTLRAQAARATLVMCKANLPADTVVAEWREFGLDIVAAEDVSAACEIASGLIGGVRDYLMSLLELPNAEQPAFLGQRRLTDLYVWADVLREECDENQMVMRSEEEEKAGRFVRNGDKRKRVAWRNEMAKVKRAVILGRPGEGKTTLAHMSMRELARRAIDDLDAQHASVRDVCMPVCLRLADVAEYGLEDAARRAVEEQPDTVAKHLLAALMSERSWLFLDAFDEVPEPARLRSALAALREAKCKVVVTSRPYGYERAHLPFASVVEYELATLTPRQRSEFVSGWFANNEERASAVLSLVQGNPSMSDLASNGLLLTLTCFTAERHTFDPQDTRRVDIYRRVVRDIVRGAWRDDALQENAPRVMALLRVCERLAWELFQPMPERSVFAEVEVWDAIEQIACGDENDKNEKKKTMLWVEQVMDQLRRVGLLVSPGLDKLMFVHRTFLEYFAAEQVARLADPVAAIEPYLWRTRPDGLDEWKLGTAEMICLTAGCMKDAKSVLARLLHEDETKPDMFRRMIVLAGRCLADVNCPSEPLLKKVAERVFDYWHGQGDVWDRLERHALGSSEVIGRLISLLQDPNQILRFRAVEALRILGKNYEREPFPVITRSENCLLFGPEDCNCLIKPQCIAQDYPNEKLTPKAVRKLQEYGKNPTLGELCLALQDSNRGRRLAAVESLAKLGHEVAIEPLSVALEDPDTNVQSSAKVALRCLVSKCGLGTILAAIRNQGSNSPATIDLLRDLAPHIRVPPLADPPPVS